MADRIVTVFGGTGFLGRRVVRDLRGRSLPAQIASRHPERVPGSSEGSAPRWIRADINDEAAVAAAVAGAYGAVNAVSLYRERGTETFHALHVKAAERLARQAQRAGVERLVHISGIGADAASSSCYIRARGEGELAVQAAFANAIIVRPAVMFGQDDAFLNALVKLLKRFPAYPMFGRGLTRLQPVSVEDVAEAIARALQPDAANPVTYELGGPQVYTYKELLKAITNRLGKRPILFSVPFPMWHALARIAEMLPGSPLSRAQVDLMEVDTAASAGMPGFAALGIEPQPIEQTLEQILAGGH
jgi:NADH dehydrogenase